MTSRSPPERSRGQPAVPTRPSTQTLDRGEHRHTIRFRGIPPLTHTVVGCLVRLEGDHLVADPHPDIERYHQPAGSETPPVDAQAVDITWSPNPGDEVAISRGSQPVASVRLG